MSQCCMKHWTWKAFSFPSVLPWNSVNLKTCGGEEDGSASKVFLHKQGDRGYSHRKPECCQQGCNPSTGGQRAGNPRDSLSSHLQNGVLHAQWDSVSKSKVSTCGRHWHWPVVSMCTCAWTHTALKELSRIIQFTLLHFRMFLCVFISIS